MTGPAVLDPLLPRPWKIIPRAGVFRPPASAVLTACNYQGPLQPLCEILRRAGLAFSPAVMATGETSFALGRPDPEARAQARWAIDDLHSRLRGRTGQLEEAYALEIDETGVAAAAVTDGGLFRAAQTLADLTRLDGTISQGSVVDRPALPGRAVLLDLSRGRAPTRRWLFEFIDAIAALRFNELTFNIEHVFTCPARPEIGVGHDPITADDLKAITDYARDRHVEIIPFQQSLGHLRHILKLPEHRDLAYDREALWSVDPAREETYHLLADLYDAQIAATRSRRFHVGCDEPFDMKKRFDPSRYGGRSLPQVVRDHLIRLHGMLKERGRQTMCWADEVVAHPEIVPDLPEDLILCHWMYGSGLCEPAAHYEPSLDLIQKSGRPFYACTSAASFMKLTPDLDVMKANHQGFAPAAKARGARGLMVTVWGDLGHLNAPGLELYPLAHAARHAWEDAAEINEDMESSFSWTMHREHAGLAGQLAETVGGINRILTGPAGMGGVALLLLFHEPFSTAVIDLTVPDPDAAAKQLRETIDRARDLLARMETAALSRRALWLDHHFPLLAAELLARKLTLIAKLKEGWPSAADEGGKLLEDLAAKCDDAAQLASGCLMLLESRWLATCRESDLEVNRGRFRRLIRAWRARAEQMRSLRESSSKGEKLPDLAKLLGKAPGGYVFDTIKEMGLAGLL